MTAPDEPASLPYIIDVDGHDAMELLDAIYMIAGYGADGDGLTADECRAVKTVAHLGHVRVKSMIDAAEDAMARRRASK